MRMCRYLYTCILAHKHELHERSALVITSFSPEIAANPMHSYIHTRIQPLPPFCASAQTSLHTKLRARPRQNWPVACLSADQSQPAMHMPRDNFRGTKLFFIRSATSSSALSPAFSSAPASAPASSSTLSALPLGRAWPTCSTSQLAPETIRLWEYSSWRTLMAGHGSHLLARCQTDAAHKACGLQTCERCFGGIPRPRGLPMGG